MLEKNTDRLFWTLTSIIVGALLLTISVKAFPGVANTVTAPLSGLTKQSDTSTKTADQAFKDATNGNTSSSNSSSNSGSSQSSQPTDPDAQAKANAGEANTLGFTVTNNGDGTGTITGYNTNNGVNVTIPKYIKNNETLLKITSIGQNAFCNDGITSVNIPNSITNIDDGAFGSPLTSDGSTTGRLKYLTIPNSVTSIGEYAFFGNKLTSINIPNSVASIGDGAFQYNKLTSVIIPNSVTTIGGGTFTHNQLTSVNIPNMQGYYQSTQEWSSFDSSVTITNNPSSN